MYKVLIVDDEPLARQGLIETIDWSEYGFEIAGDTDNATSAKEMCLSLRPDVIITDICMEPIDGLTLIEELKEENRDLEFIVISGYGEFSYAQRAMKHGVSTYILKPIENEDLIHALAMLKEKLDKQNKINSIIEKYTDKLDETRLLELIFSNERTEEVYDKHIKAGFNFPQDKNFVVASMSVINPPSDTDEKIHLNDILIKTVKDTFALKNNKVITALYKETYVIAVIFSNDDNKLQPEQIMQVAINNFTTQTGKQVSVGLSGIVSKIAMLPRAYIQAEKALKKLSESDKNIILCYTSKFDYNEKHHTPILTTKQTEELLEAITLSKHSSARNIIDSYFDSLDTDTNISIDEIKNSIISVAVYIIQRYIKAPEMTEAIFGRNISPAKEIWELQSINQIRMWLTAFTEKLMDNKQIKEFSSYTPLIQNAISYIMSNYSRDCDINLVANKFYVSSGHLMRQFKQETGKTFLEYLTEYRINISITLLQSKNYKIYEICEMVGYNNTKYFGKIFKKVTGRNPKDYM